MSISLTKISLAEAFRFWLKLGFISFGGPTGQIAIMHTELVDRRKWISEERFLHALNYCMLLPGPEAQQLATYVGWLLHKTLGGVIAGTLFVLPSALLLWLLSYVYVCFGDVHWIAAVFCGLKPAVLGIVAAAVLRLGQKALKSHIMWSIAGLAFVAIYFFKIPFPMIIAMTAVVGLVGGRYWRQQFAVLKNHGQSVGESVIGDEFLSAEHTRPSLARAVRITLVCLVLWWLPVALTGMLLGSQHALFREGIFFSKAAMVTFGGAYSVLPYVSQRAVEHYQWLEPGQMLDGLGLAESTPGPLIMVLQFVGFLGGWNQPGTLPPLLAATFGAAITTWTTFVPCFLWIFLGAPHVEQMRRNDKLTSALSAVTAAVVGVVLNLAVWFGAHLLFPVSGRLDWFALAVSTMAFVGLARFKWNVVPVVLGGAAVGVVRWKLIGM